MSANQNEVPVIQIVITWVPGQPVQVNGPLQDKLLCYGILEAAKDAIRAFVMPAIQVPTPEQAQQINKNGNKIIN